MGTDSEGDIAGRCRGSGTDRISGLPDNLLHSILLRLPGTADAARTSVLARRWRGVWTQLPELSLSTAKGHAAVDAALAAYSAPIVRRLEINSSPGFRADIPAYRVSSWLDFASLHLAGELRLDILLSLKRTMATDEAKAEEIVLPLCERVTTIFLSLCHQTMRFQLPPAGVFSALATLSITDACVDGQELEDVLCSRCPCLKQLVLFYIRLRGGSHVPSIQSDSLERLEITSQFQGCLQISTPELQTFCTLSVSDFHISAPKLSEVDWNSNVVYDPSRHHFTESGHHLQRLVVAVNYVELLLMQRFDNVKELELNVCIEQGVKQYKRFLEDTNKLANCEVLVVRLQTEHSYKPTMLRLLRKCAGLRKLVVKLVYRMDDIDYPCKSGSGCPCSWLENRRTNNIVLDSLEEVEMRDHGKTSDKVELVRLFATIGARCEKRVSITVSEKHKDIHEKIRSICPPNDKVEIVVRST